MSTEFFSDTTKELAFVRFAGGPVRPSLEFRTATNFENVCAALDRGDTFTSLRGATDDCNGVPGRFTDRQQLEDLMVAGRVTFGHFPLGLALSSGEAVRFSEEVF